MRLSHIECPGDGLSPHGGNRHLKTTLANYVGRGQSAQAKGASDMSDLNDPRVLFAAERTLLAWSRTGLTLMGFGFLIERFGLFLRLFAQQSMGTMGTSHGFSFWIGIVFIVLGVMMTGLSNVQFHRVLRTLKPIEIPAGYFVNLGVVANIVLTVLGIALIAYLIVGFH